jgi:hypothetical protein
MMHTCNIYATVQQEADVWFVGTFLDDIGRELSARRVELCCRQCGKEICYDGRDPRTDAQYCGPACRQRAYRSRVTTSAPKREREPNGNSILLRLWQQKGAASRNANPDARADEDAQARTTIG